MKNSTRFISFFLAVLMCLSLLPIGAMAEDTTTETENTVETEAPVPTVAPTAEATTRPSSATDTDTPAATPIPTAALTADPSPVPTAVPTAEPTPEPTAAATETPAPTAEPTPVPTAVPTAEPTATPEPTETATPDPAATPVPTTTPEAEIIASGTCGDNLTWTLDSNGLLTISGTGDMEDWDPTTDSPWRGSSSIKEIYISNGVTSIGDFAFYYCRKLTSITIPTSVTLIMSAAFWSCSNLSNVVYTGPAEQWYSIDFCGSKTLIDIANIPLPTSGTCGDNLSWSMEDGTLTISGTGAMNDYTQYTPIWKYAASEITAVNIEDGVTKIGNYAFYGFTALTSISIAESVTSIGEHAFFGCTSITNVTIPEGVVELGSYSFYRCSNLTSITLPSSLESVAAFAFYECKNLATVYYNGFEALWYAIDINATNDLLLSAELVCLGSGPADETNVTWSISGDVLTISGSGRMVNYDLNYTPSDAGYAIADGVNTPWYSKRSSIKHIVIEEGVLIIGKNAFWGLDKVESISVPASLLSKIPRSALTGCGNIQNFYVAEGSTIYTAVDGILCSSDGTTLLKYPTGRTEIILPESITTIAAYAFSDCLGLTSVSIPLGVAFVGSYHFQNCTNLTEVEIPEGITTLDNTFDGCTSLTELYLPASVTSVTGFPSSLIAIHVSEDNPVYTSIEGFLYNKDCTKLLAIPKGNTGTLVIPDTVTNFDELDFRRSNLTGLIIPEGVTSLWVGPFADWKNLKTVTIPISMEFIEEGTFGECTSLETAYYYGTAEQWNAIEIGAHNEPLINACVIKPLKYGTCGENLSWNLDDFGVLTISGTGEMTHYNHNGAPWSPHKELIKSVVLEEGVTSTNLTAFYGLPVLTDIYFPASLTNITSKTRLAAIENFHVADGNSVFATIDGVLFSSDKTSLILYPMGRTESSYIIPQGTAALEYESFLYCNNLCELFIPASVIRIGDIIYDEVATGVYGDITRYAILECSSLDYIRYLGSEDHWAQIECYDLIVPICGSGWAICGSDWYWVTEEGTFLCSDWAHDGSGWCWFDAEGRMVSSQWVDDLYYCGEDGYRVTGWQKISGSWYYFDADGLKLTGWQIISGSTYYFGTDGIMVTGWQDIDGSRYRFNSSGVMQTGWLSLSGKWYYLEPISGVMQTGWTDIGSKTYYMNESGVMQTGWTEIDGDYYYLDDTLQYGWLQRGSNWYYLHPETGVMLTGWQTINGKLYYMNESGVMQTGWVMIDGNYYYLNDHMQTGWIKSGSTWYYLNPTSGIMQTGWAEISGKLYYFNTSGSLKTGWFESDRMGDGETEWYYLTSSGAKTGWYKSGSSWYYFAPSSSIMQTGWAEISGKLYYFNTSGSLKTGWFESDRMGDGETEWYYLTSSGAKTSVWYKSGGYWYWFKEDSVMAVSETLVIDGVSYTFNSSGHWIS